MNGARILVVEDPAVGAREIANRLTRLGHEPAGGESRMIGLKAEVHGLFVRRGEPAQCDVESEPSRRSFDCEYPA